MLAVYGDNLDILILTTQLQSLKVNFSSDERLIKDLIETLKTFSVKSREYFFEVIILLNILLVQPATHAVGKRSA